MKIEVNMHPSEYRALWRRMGKVVFVSRWITERFH